VRDAQKRDARTLVPSIPEDLNEILNKLMSRSRSQRFQSGQEVALALRVFLDRQRPGYRRSHFGRFMREEFAEEIEKELRLLEEYVIDAGDPSKVGENLIADALGDNPIYTQFTAGISGAGAGGYTGATPIGSAAADLPDALPPLPDVHDMQTRILSQGAPEPSHLHADETHILGSEGPERSLHAEETRILANQFGETDDPPHAKQVHDLETRILDHHPESLHDLQTRILDSPETPASGNDFGPPTEPGPALFPGSPKVVISQSDDEVSDDEQTTVPLADEDLEPA
jgi:hypothetical protein